MRVSLAADVFAEPAMLPDILDLLRTFSSGPHDLVASPESTAIAVKYLAVHAPGMADTYALLASKGTVAAAWTPVPAQGMVVHVTAATLADHAADLRRPAVLVLEDLDSDGSFVKALCTALRMDRVLRALDAGWLEIRHGGGATGLYRVATEEASRFRKVVRVAALFDSDRKMPGHPSVHDGKAAQLMALGVTVHVLTYREAENYVPNRVLAGLGRNRSQASLKLRHLKVLTQDQRAHFDMKRGFGPSGTVPADQQALFVGLPPSHARHLARGFGNDLLRKFHEASFGLTASDFAGLGQGVLLELRGLLDKIASVI